jgi:hypothetical protein
MKMNEDIQFSNMDSWRGGSSGKFGLTFKQIVLQHINRCVVNGSVEWHGGYQQSINRGNYSDYVYVPNSRDVYCNSVAMLRALLLGYFDKQIKETDKQLQEAYEKEYAEFKEQEDKKGTKYEWYNYKVDWHIKLFEQLIMLSKRLNFFEEETSEEEM